jgi:hypothetical protein
MRSWLASLCVLALVGASVPGRADEPALRHEEGAQLRARSELLEVELARERRRARVWFWGWFTVYGATVGVSTALAATSHSRHEKDIQGVNAVTAGLGLIALLTPPLPRLAAPPRPRSDGELDVHAKLAEQLARLERAADQEVLLRSALAHVGNVAVGVGAGLYLGLRGNDVWREALPAGVASMAVGLAQILTTPRVATRLRDQLAREHGVGRLRISPWVGPRAVGLRAVF